MPEDQKTCRICGYGPYTPNFRNDFYEDGVDGPGTGICEKCLMSKMSHSKDPVKIDEKHMRPEELDVLKGDSSKLRKAINWEPKYTFETMLDEMIDYWVDFYKKNPNVDN